MEALFKDKFAAADNEGLGDDSDDDVAAILHRIDAEVRDVKAARVITDDDGGRPRVHATVAAVGGVLDERAPGEVAVSVGMGVDDDAALRQRLPTLRFNALVSRSVQLKVLREDKGKVRSEFQMLKFEFEQLCRARRDPPRNCRRELTA